MNITVGASFAITFTITESVTVCPAVFVQDILYVVETERFPVFCDPERAVLLIIPPVTLHVFAFVEFQETLAEVPKAIVVDASEPWDVMDAVG